MLKDVISPEKVIECEICLREIPQSVNQNAEADEYVSGYCGLDCYQIWKSQQQINKDDSE